MPAGAAIAIGTVAAGAYSANAAKKGAKQQANAISESSDAAVAEQRRQFDVTQQNLAPWLESGRNALSRLNDPQSNFLASPGYEFARTEGMRGIERTAAARGGAASGNALRDLAAYDTGLASQEYGNWWNQQAGLAGAGQTTATNLGQFGQNSANNIGNILTSSGQAIGDARASGTVGAANALTGALSNGINSWLYFRQPKTGAGGGTNGGMRFYG